MAATHAIAMGSALLRRFCSCGVDNDCRCGLPRRLTGWTVEGLAELRQLMREHHSLDVVASLIGETKHECNKALDALLGATPTHALARLEAQSAKNLRAPRHFLAVHGTSGEQGGSRVGTAEARR